MSDMFGRGVMCESEMRTGIRPADWCAAVRSLPAARKPVRLDWQLALSSQPEQTCL